MSDSASKLAWEAQNTVRVSTKINKNQNPELYNALMNAESRGGLARELMQEGLEARKAKLNKMLQPD